MSPSVKLVNLEGEEFTNLNDIPAGLYKLKLHKRGYFTNSMIINVVGGKTQKYNVSLRKQTLGPSDLAVTLNWND